MTHTTEQERAEFLQMHADFEREFGPMPQDCKWSGTGFYQTSHHAWQAQEYAHKFDGFKAAWQAARRAPAVPTRNQIEQYLYEQGVVTVSRDVAEAAGLARLAGNMQSAPVVPVPLRKPTIDQVADAVGYHDSAWDCVDPSELIDAILMLAAAPQPPEAAQLDDTNVADMAQAVDSKEAASVQLPEPVAKIEGGSLKWHIPDTGYSLPVRYLQGTENLYTEHQVRQLLSAREQST